MNEHDRLNLAFLLGASEEVLRDWYNTVSDDDRLYASELLNAYSQELRQQAQALRTTCEIELQDTLESSLSDHHYPQAAALLAKFRL